ncbi:MAG: formylglycine-generating enzyme family protein, partial [Treponema sp.]|nr:formylglycine-generating enzyme family protein [Treponema sp.]
TFSGGDNPALVAWTSANSNGSPRMVGLLNANGLGLHDMSGNVWEWTQSRFTASHPGGSQVDWTGPAGSERVLRGGSMSGGANEARSVVRLRFDPFPAVNSGFRLVRPAP